jgi:ribonuclease VapC
LILDSSALIAVLLREDGRERLLDAIDSAPEVVIGTPTVVESSIVLVRRFGLVGRLMLSRFLGRYSVVVLPFDERHWNAAADAFVRFGKGRHPARLNYGDCMTYAMARVAGAPLLFVGGDFARTDLAFG